MWKTKKYDEIKNKLKKIRSNDKIENKNILIKINSLNKKLESKINTSDNIYTSMKENIKKFKKNYNKNLLNTYDKNYKEIKNLNIEYKLKVIKTQKENINYRNKSNILISNSKSKFNQEFSEFQNNRVNINDVMKKWNKMKSDIKNYKKFKEESIFSLKKNFNIKLKNIKLVYKNHKETVLNDQNKQIKLLLNLKENLNNNLNQLDENWKKNIENIFAKIEDTFNKFE